MRKMCESLDLNYDKLRKKWNFLLIVGLVGVIGLYIILQEILYFQAVTLLGML